jgi:hypothetical protein
MRFRYVNANPSEQVISPAISARFIATNAGTNSSGGRLREGTDVKFSFIARHRGIWPVGWLCEALGVSRGGLYAWLTRLRSQRSRRDEECFGKQDFVYLSDEDAYRCPAGEKLKYYYTTEENGAEAATLLDKCVSPLCAQATLHHRRATAHRALGA